MDSSQPMPKPITACAPRRRLTTGLEPIALPLLVLLGCDASSRDISAASDAGAEHDASMDAGPDDSTAGDAEASIDGELDASTSKLTADGIGEAELIAGGFGLAESPLWDHCHDRLLFTDVTGGDSGILHTANANGEIGVLATDTSNTNGIAFDVDGSLILAQMGGAPGHIARRDAAGRIEVLEPDGSPPLHTPDDVIVHSDGTIYFSDGDFYPIGSLLGFAAPLPVYMLRPGGTELIAVATVSGPNGVELSPDEHKLYVSAYGAGMVMVYDVAEDGTLSGETALLTGLSNPDSLCLDVEGNLYVAVNAGLLVTRPDGTTVTTIPIAAANPLFGATNCTFGGDDGRTLFVTAWDSLYKVENMPVEGLDWAVNKERQQQCPVGPDDEMDAGADEADAG